MVYSNEEILERFAPQLDEAHTMRFQTLVGKKDQSVISIDEIAKFPTVFSERSLVQLAKLKEFLADGHKVHYCIVSLNPYVKGIQILKDTMFQQMLQDCLSNGMTISGHTCRIKDGKVQLEKVLPISSISSESSGDKIVDIGYLN